MNEKSEWREEVAETYPHTHTPEGWGFVKLKTRVLIDNFVEWQIRVIRLFIPNKMLIKNYTHVYLEK